MIPGPIHLHESKYLLLRTFFIAGKKKVEVAWKLAVARDLRRMVKTIEGGDTWTHTLTLVKVSSYESHLHCRKKKVEVAWKLARDVRRMAKTIEGGNGTLTGVFYRFN